MRYIPVLLSSEKSTLLEGYRHHPKSHVRQRMHVILLSSEGKTVPYLADLYKIKPRTIYDWFNRWAELGIAGLFILPGRGLKSVFANISAEQTAVISSEILANPQQAKRVAHNVSIKLNLQVSEKQLKSFLKKT